MNKKNTNRLLEKYPKIFAQHKLSCRETAMCWLFSCGDGWYDIIDTLAFIIQQKNEQAPEAVKKSDYYPMQAVQVKEKWGGLRFYMNASTDYIDGAIRMAEEMSYRICEDCGSTDGVAQTSSGWVRTLCKKCTSSRTL